MKKSGKIAGIGRWSIYALAAALLLSGLLLVWEPRQDAFAGAASAQALGRQVHGALAMLALLGLGALAGHVSVGWTTRQNRAAGVLLVSALLILTVSAWMLYYASPGPLRDGASRIHLWLGCALAPLLALHVALGRASARKGRPS
jgi:hypothetical protein